MEWVVVAGAALSALYEVPLGEIGSEEELLALAERGELSEESLQSLLRLWQEGVEPETATRAELLELPGLLQAEVEALLAYRQKHGRLGGVEAWLGLGLVSEEQARQLRPFVRSTHNMGGRFHLKTAGTWTDERMPPVLVGMRLESTLGFRVGANLNLTRLYAQKLRVEEQTGQLHAKAEGFLLRLPSVFAQAQWKNVQLSVGNFRLGFGERLTLSNSFKQRPHGVEVGEYSRMQRENKRKCPSSLGSGCKQSEQIYITPDFGFVEGFRGLALSSTLPLSSGWELEGTLFASWQSRDLYQYAFFNPAACPQAASASPSFPPQSPCSAPPLYVEGHHPLRHSYATLANAFEERLLGMAAHAHSPSFSLGMVGYMADNRFGLSPLKPRFQPWASTLNGAFGALGLHAQAQVDMWLVAGEASRSFDEEGGGGFAAVVRVENEAPPQHSGLELRWLSPRFKNPMAKPRAGPNMFWGARAINEWGVFAHSQWKLSPLLLYASFNLWQILEGYNLTPSGTFHLESRLRLEWQAFRQLKPFVSFSSSSRNLFKQSQAMCEEEVESSSSSLCNALRASVGLKMVPLKNMSLLLRVGGFRKRFVSNPTAWGNGMEAEAEWRWQAWRWFSPSLWLLWRQEDWGDTQRLGHLLWLRLVVHATLAHNFEAHYAWAFGRALGKRTGERNDGHMRLELSYRF
ncbi:MAG: helix-hairpin-helix domain-containing protein [Cystobacterineae bacterium]|nr:helix-hairpin-helix domain-containing protein [Cystobacterineae bacterium]